MVGSGNDHSPACKMGREECALETHAAVAVAKQNDGELTISYVGVATCCVVVTCRHVSGQKSLKGRRYEVAGVVKLSSSGSFYSRIPNFNFVARGKFKRGDSDGERTGFGVHHRFNGRIKSCAWSLGR